VRFVLLVLLLLGRWLVLGRGAVVVGRGRGQQRRRRQRRAVERRRRGARSVLVAVIESAGQRQPLLPMNLEVLPE